ncbi:MAG: CapA family protein [Clostridia bacterium]|nr:CapA family protein [Clostridia bacterium]
MTLLSAGDNLLHRGVLRDGQGQAAGSDADFYFDFIFDGVKAEISAADFAVINQESIILEKRKLSNKVENFFNKTTSGSFVTPSDMMDTLKRVGFDGIDMGNNHMLDMGAAGLQWSIQYLDGREDLLRIGAYLDEEDRENIPVAETNGIKVAYLGYTYGTNVPKEVAEKEQGFRFLVPYIDDEQMISDLAAAKQVADFTVVYIHWGEENTFKPSGEQRRVAKLLAENGAGAIIGHHSHTIQPIEWVDDGRGGRVLCAYSLGTLVSNMAVDYNMLAGFLTFRLDKYDDGTVKLEDPIFTPTVFYYDMSYKQSRIYYLCEMTDALCSSHGIGNYPKDQSVKNTMTLDRLYKYLEDTIDPIYLPKEYRK